MQPVTNINAPKDLKEERLLEEVYDRAYNMTVDVWRKSGKPIEALELECSNGDFIFCPEAQEIFNTYLEELSNA